MSSWGTAFLVGGRGHADALVSGKGEDHQSHEDSEFSLGCDSERWRAEQSSDRIPLVFSAGGLAAIGD